MTVHTYGESLIRYDISPKGKVNMYPVGTGINVLSNLSELSDVKLNILTGLTNKKDSLIFKKFFKEKNIQYNDSFVSNYKPIGSYSIYRTHNIFGWEVVYNRETTTWTDFSQSTHEMISNVKKGDIFHFDGISLMSSLKSAKKVLFILKKIIKLNVIISFDFNFRWSMNNSKKILLIFQEALRFVDIINISYYDINLLNGDKKDNKPNIDKFNKKFPNVKFFVGTRKMIIKNNLQIFGFIREGNKLRYSNEKIFSPKELIGQGDAFIASVLTNIITKKSIDIDYAIEWSIYKTNYRGDSTVQTLDDFINYKKGINIIR